MPQPFPIIVGVPRSGTTLFRFMLCAAGTLAIPPETAFIPRLAGLDDRDAFLDAITAFPTWEDFTLTRDDLLSRLPPDIPFTAAAGLRAFYAAYAARHGTARAGDKTPVYLQHMPAIARLLPETVFLHLIRDGRDVALSWSDTWFAPSHDPRVLLDLWADQVAVGRAAAAGVTCLEIRFEDLVARPAETLRRVCAAIDLTFDPAMCSPATAARRLLPEHGDRHDRDGSIVITRADRLRHSARTMDPVDPDRVGRWRNADPPLQPSPKARALLDALGYDAA